MTGGEDAARPTTSPAPQIPSRRPFCPERASLPLRMTKGRPVGDDEVYRFADGHATAPALRATVRPAPDSSRRGALSRHEAVAAQNDRGGRCRATHHSTGTPDSFAETV